MNPLDRVKRRSEQDLEARLNEAYNLGVETGRTQITRHDAYKAGIAEGQRRAEVAVRAARQATGGGGYMEPYCQADIDFCCANARRKLACSCLRGPHVPAPPTCVYCAPGSCVCPARSAPADVWVAVSFNPARDSRMYYYVTNDVTIRPGVKVRVPSGSCNEPKDAWVVYLRQDRPSLSTPIKRIYGRAC